MGNWLKLIAIFTIIAILSYFAVGTYQDSLNLGLDLQGGVHVVMEAQEGASDEDMAKVVTILRNRIDQLGVTEPIIQREGDRRVIVELPGVENPEEAVNIIGQTALLEFKTFDGTVVVSGKDLKDAREGKNPENNEAYVGLEFTSDGAKKFAQATQNLVDSYPEGTSGERDPRRNIAIYLDGNLIQNPYVSTPILNGQASIAPYVSLQEAHNVALLLRSGALPVPVEMIEKRTVGPTLGDDSLEKSKIAAIYGVAAIMIFMLFYYRLPGLVANISLVVYSLIVLGILTTLKATLTLPGIAGFLLSIGMAVDANIIIYERLKEELRAGKTLRAAISSGFKRAFWTIFDANVTTLIAASVLFYFGTGPIRGFAVTLSIGILTSMFTAITVTRTILNILATMNVFRNTKLYGA